MTGHMHITIFCMDCQDFSGPFAHVTPLGLAFGTDENKRHWHTYIKRHGAHNLTIQVDQ